MDGKKVVLGGDGVHVAGGSDSGGTDSCFGGSNGCLILPTGSVECSR